MHPVHVVVFLLAAVLTATGFLLVQSRTRVHRLRRIIRQIIESQSPNREEDHDTSQN